MFLSVLSSTLFALSSQSNWLSSPELMGQSRLTGGSDRVPILSAWLVRSSHLLGFVGLVYSSTLGTAGGVHLKPCLGQSGNISLVTASI